MKIGIIGAGQIGGTLTRRFTPDKRDGVFVAVRDVLRDRRTVDRHS